MTDLEKLQKTIVSCTKCPRLLAYQREVAHKKRRMYLDWDYWAKPVPAFGDPEARVLILGLAPAAHGGNRTGRMFTGDRSGDWVYNTLHKYGFAKFPDSTHKNDGQALHDAYITAAMRCAPPLNKPLPEELANCRPYLLRELDLLTKAVIVVALGKIAFDTLLAVHKEQSSPLLLPRPKFIHGTVYELGNGKTLVVSYHPSQQNTQTGRLTRQMFEDVFTTVRRLLS